MKDKKYCAISVDVDSFSSILKFNGEDKSKYGSYDPVYEKSIPRFLQLFEDHGIRATFFIVAEDCMEKSKADMVKMIYDRGHEIANHSLSHSFAFSMLKPSEKEEDIKKSTRMIKDACGRSPVGFRVPGYDIDEVTLEILEKEKYSYDSSLYKFFLYPILRRISYLKVGAVAKKDMFKNMVKELCDSIFHPMTPYFPKGDNFRKDGRNNSIIEIPLSVTPFLNIPFNTTFLFMTGRGLFDFGLWLTKNRGLGINYNFHPTDIIDTEEDKVSLKHPGTEVPFRKKIDLFHRMFDLFDKNFKFNTLENVAHEYKK